MKCKTIQSQLEDHLKQRLDPATENAVTTHLATCPACRRELAFLKTYLSALHPLESESAPADLLQRIERAVPTPEQSVRFPWNRRVFYAFSGLGLGTALVIIVVLCAPRLNPVLPNQKVAFKPTQAQTQPLEPGLLQKPGSLQKADTAFQAPEPDRLAKTVTAHESKTVLDSEARPAQPERNTLLVTLSAADLSELQTGPKMRAFSLPQAKKSAEAAGPENTEAETNAVPDREQPGNDALQFKANLTQLLHNYRGQIIKEESDPNTQRLSRLILKVPAEFYLPLLTELGKTNSTRSLGPEASPSPQASWQQVELQFEYR